MSFAALSEQGAAMAAQYVTPPRKKRSAASYATASKKDGHIELATAILTMIQERGSITRDNFPGVHEYKFKMATLHLKDKIKYVGHAPRGDWRLR